MHTFSVGEVLKRSFGIWIKNLVPFMLITLLVSSPVIIYTLMVLDPKDFDLDAFERNRNVLRIAGFAIDILITGALVYGVMQQLRGQHASVGKCLGVGLQRMLPALGVGILVALCFFGGLLLLIVPGVIIYCMLYVAVPVAVIEKPGVLASLKRSRELTQGYKGSIFGILFLLFIIALGFGIILSRMIMGEATEAASIEEYLSSVRSYVVIGQLMEAAFSSLGAVACAVVYHDLRLVKEGVGIEELAAVFD